MLYTSYYANYRNFPRNSLRISISRTAPVNSNDEAIKELAPSSLLLAAWKNNDIDEKEYTTIYLKQLEDLNNLSQIVEYLKQASATQDVILLCYEKPPRFCHRHLLSDYLKKNFSINIKELDYE